MSQEYPFEQAKYHGKWAVYDKISHCYDYIGIGKRAVEKKCKELNERFGPMTENDKKMMHQSFYED